MPRLLLLCAIAAAFRCAVHGTPANLRVRDDPAIEPWSYLNGGAFAGPAQPLSPDPLVEYRWSSAVNATPLQCYDMLPVAISVIPGTPPTSFTGLSSLVAPGVNASAIVSGPGAFVFDIAVVSPFLFKHYHTDPMHNSCSRVAPSHVMRPGICRLDRV